MPDAWELANGLNPGNAVDGNDIGPDGYSHVERYLKAWEAGLDGDRRAVGRRLSRSLHTSAVAADAQVEPCPDGVTIVLSDPCEATGGVTHGC